MPHESNTTLSHDLLLEIVQAIGQTKYGSIEITVHEGRVTQLERREKVRFSQDIPRQRTTAETTVTS
ncbi:YezD family protein [Methylobacillus sp.]|uniref:YezD family protein n=1 Tax=Methylobacillus sp. TaxID=56818 RepID=UPI002FE036F9